MNKTKVFLGYSAAGLTVAAALLIPFVLLPLFTAGVAATGIRIDPVYTGGDPDAVIEKGDYRLIVNRPVRSSAPLPQTEPFVQLAWTPAEALPPQVEERVDIDRDGLPDVEVAFDVPLDPKAVLFADVKALSPVVRTTGRISRDSFSSLIARVGHRIVLRVRVD
jgi:hypothetical protein